MPISQPNSQPDHCEVCDQPLPVSGGGTVCPACLVADALAPLDSLSIASPGSLEAGSRAGADPDSAAGAPDKLAGTTIGHEGRYKILQHIGEGGFGTVYMADQTAPVRRRVAVKVLKAGMDTRQVVARFEAERQALAMMDHPNIARIIDGGETDQGRPFFVMELVRGIPITDFCDEENLGTRQRLQLFMKVCGAVQHAHQKGIIHRDLKPGNILVTVEDGAEPVPKVIDFGVAKAADAQLTDKTLFTRFEQMIGTPAYMSPEQAGARAAHDIDTRADIYALGVLLYELLTGTTPIETATLKGAAFDEVRRILREDEAPRPSARLSSLELNRRTTIAKSRATESAALGKQLRGDLDWIVMKAIEKDRRRRYETANALAEDVERHLEDEPVSAGPPKLCYKMGKFVRRNRVIVTGSIATLGAILIGLLLALHGYREADARAVEAVNSRRTAEAEAANSEQTLQFLLENFLRPINPATNSDQDLTLAATIDQALVNLETAPFKDPKIEARIRQTLADAFFSLGRTLDAERQFAIAAQKLTDFRGSTHPDTIAAERKYAYALAHLGKFAEAVVVLEKLVPEWEAAISTADGSALQLLSDIAQSKIAAGNHSAGAAMLTQVLDRQKKVLGVAHPNTQESLSFLIHHYHATIKSFEIARQFQDDFDFSILAQAGSPRAILSACQPQNAYGLDYNAHAHLLRARAEETVRTLGPKHPEALSLRLAYALFLRPVGKSEEGVEWSENLLRDLTSRLEPSHEWIMRLGGDYIWNAYCNGRRDVVREFADEMMKPMMANPRVSTLRNQADTLPMIYFSIYGRWGEAAAFCRAICESDSSVDLHLFSGIAALGAQDREAYSLATEKVVEKFADSSEPAVLSKVAELFLAGQFVTGVDAASWQECATSFVDRGVGSDRVKNKVLRLRLEMAMHDYRNLEEAVDKVTHDLAGVSIDIFDSLWLMIARCTVAIRKQDLALAEDYLTSAQRYVEENQFVVYWWWEFLPICHALERLAADSKLSQFTGWEPTKIFHEDTSAYQKRIKKIIAKKTLEKKEALSLAADSPAVKGVLVSPNSEWRWLHPVDGVDPAESDPGFHHRFSRADYDDTPWPRGKDSEESTGGFGYGDEGFTGVDIGTPSTKALGKSAYFRHRFTTDEEFTNLELRCHRDDGIIVYLDGNEVGRGNMSDGEEAYRLPAAGTVGGDDETTVYRLPLDDVTLPPGEHVLAISLHNTEVPSSDLRIGGITLVEVE